MTHRYSDIRDLLQRYVLDTATADERAQVDALLEDDPRVQAILEEESRRLRLLDLLSDTDPNRDLAAGVERALDEGRDAGYFAALPSEDTAPVREPAFPESAPRSHQSSSAENLDDPHSRADLMPERPSHERPAQRPEIATTRRPSSEGVKQRRPRWKSVIPYAAAAAAVVLIITLLPALSRSREAARRASSQNNLKQLGLAMKMYASESRGEFYPPLAPYDGVWMVDLRCLVPKYVSDPATLVDPAHPRADELADEMQAILAKEPVDWERLTRLAAQSYVYPGWLVDDPDDLPDFVRGVRQLARADYGNDIRVGDKIFHRHREGIERFLITDINNPAASASAQSEIPIMFERVPAGTSTPEGINVLYMDGHVEFVRFGAKYPATEAATEAFPPPSPG